MRLFFLACGCFLFLSCFSGASADAAADAASRPMPDTFNLVLIQGESNASGMASNDKLNGRSLKPFNTVFILNNQRLVFEPLQIGKNNNLLQNVPDGKHGLELGLALEAEAGAISTPLYIVKAGWSGGKMSDFTPGSGAQWVQLQQRMDSAISSLKKLGRPYRITVWQSIGINDFNGGTSSADFTNQLTAFRQAFRERYGQRILFLQTHFFDSHPFNSNIKAVAAADSLQRARAISIEGATYVDPNIHWDSDGLQKIAHRMVEAMQQAK